MTNVAPALQQSYPEHRDIPWERAEPLLSDLYAHAPGSVRLSMIRTPSGAVAGPDGSSRSLNGPADLRILRTVRACADVVVVGAQTARDERYGDIALPEDLAQARAIRGLAPDVPLAVVTRSGTLPPSLTPQRTWIVTTATSAAGVQQDEAWQGRVIIAGVDEFAPSLLISQLRAWGLTRVVCEGGAQIARSFADAGVIDEWCYTTSPHPGGADSPTAPPVPEGLSLAHRLSGGGFTMERWVEPKEAARD